MSAPLSLPSFSASDPRWRDCRHNIEIATAAADEDLTSIGGSPYSDLGRTGLRVPEAATTALTNRYLFRLCAIEIPGGFAVILRGLRQLATIRAEDTLNAIPLVLEREVVSPNWSFLDGNISWHLRWQPDKFSTKRYDIGQTGGTSPDTRGLSPALLYIPNAGGGSNPYTAPGGGRPPGKAVGSLGTFRDIRFAWDSSDWAMNWLIRGPGVVAFYASVRQTDPGVRPLYPDADGMRPEDRFLSNFQVPPNNPDDDFGCRYGRVAGSMIVQPFPCCELTDTDLKAVMDHG